MYLNGRQVNIGRRPACLKGTKLGVTSTDLVASTSNASLKQR